MSDTSDGPNSTAPLSEMALRRAADNWLLAKTALVERIRQRWNALTRLTSGTLEDDLIEAQLRTLGDDAAALLHLAAQVDHRLDLAFVTRSRRVTAADAPKPGTRLRAEHEEFKAR